TARSAGVCQLTATARLRRFLAGKNHRKLDPVSLQFFLTTFSRFENYQNLQVPRFLAKRFKRLERSACPEQRRRKAIEIPLMVSLACPEVLEGSNHWNDWNGPVTVRTIHEHVFPPLSFILLPSSFKSHDHVARTRRLFPFLHSLQRC